ncbi:MAG: cobalt-precorrin-6A reductase [Phreatobacter sp.]|nr:cobalt-precorrin-6A reductase [Phreatobacter sp.]
MALLILGGTSEAAALAAQVAAMPDVPALVSLAGRTSAPLPLALPMRVGGFGGATGLAAFLRDSGVKAVVDATHPFAAIMPFNAETACRAAGVNLVALRRPEWAPVAGDRWLDVPDMATAALALGREPKRVLLTIGRQELAAFAAAPQHHYLARMIDEPKAGHGLPDLTVIRARGPFALADEIDLMRSAAIDTVVAKNAGGSATEAKLAAARALGIAVVMVARPAKPGVPVVETVEAAVGWLKDHGILPTERGV